MSARLLAAGVACAALTVLAAASPASADPTCEGYKGVANHGEHVIEDYVLGAVIGGPTVETWPPSGGLGEIAGEGAALPGGPGAGFHMVVGAPPGASFCVPQAQSGDR